MKAFYKVNQEILLDNIKNVILQLLLQAITNLYEDTKIVNLPKKLNRNLSFALFNIYMDEILQE